MNFCTSQTRIESDEINKIKLFFVTGTSSKKCINYKKNLIFLKNKNSCYTKSIDLSAILQVTVTYTKKE